jgi:GrpB-like predicted nucleotidyltransferase (UPF0157 family)
MKTETIIEPNEKIFGIQQKYFDALTTLFPNLTVELIGGMSVPMIGRPELDLMVISDDLENDSKLVEEMGFKQGPVEPDKASYLKMIEDGVDVTVQILCPGNSMIERHRSIRTILKGDDRLRKQYEEFKKTLAGLERQEYRAKKKEWLATYMDPILKTYS